MKWQLPYGGCFFDERNDMNEEIDCYYCMSYVFIIKYMRLCGG
jgi:hypothetical protein